jgi:hypothetical protein
MAWVVLVMKVVGHASVSVTVKSPERLKALQASLKALADRRVLVGFPRATNKREGNEPINNAELGYIHNYGAPEAHIPQREFMRPGFQAVLSEVIDLYKSAAKAACRNESVVMSGASFAELDKYLHRIGLRLQASIKQTIRAGLSPELAAATVAARIARRKSKKWRRQRQIMVDANVAAGKAPGAGIFTPLIDTAAMLNSITYVIRKPKATNDLILGPTPGRK